jgi:hypothetical protein
VGSRFGADLQPVTGDCCRTGPTGAQNGTWAQQYAKTAELDSRLRRLPSAPPANRAAALAWRRRARSGDPAAFANRALILHFTTAKRDTPIRAILGLPGLADDAEVTLEIVAPDGPAAHQPDLPRSRIRTWGTGGHDPHQTQRWREPDSNSRSHHGWAAARNPPHFKRERCSGQIDGRSSASRRKQPFGRRRSRRPEIIQPDPP